MSILFGRGPFIQGDAGSGSPPGAGSPPSGPENTYTGKAIMTNGSTWYSKINANTVSWSVSYSDYGAIGNNYPYALNQYGQAALCFDDTYFHTQWRKLTSPISCRYRAFSRSGTTLTSITDISGSSSYTYYDRGSTWLSSTSALVSGESGIMVITINGSGQLTRNTGGAVNTSTAHIQMILETIDTNTCIGVGNDGTDFVAQCFTVSGTTVTAYTATAIVVNPTSKINWQNSYVCRLNDTHFVICYNDIDNTKHYFQVCKINASHIITKVGSAYEFNGSATHGTPRLLKTSYPAVSGSHQLYWVGTNGTDCVHAGVQIDETDYSFTVGSITTLGSGTGTREGAVCSVATADQYLIVCTSTTDADWFIQAIEYTDNSYQGITTARNFDTLGAAQGGNYTGYMDWFSDNAIYLVYYARPASHYLTRHTAFTI